MADIVEDVLEGRFTLELPQARLVQRGSDNPIVYEGAGFIDQLADGELRLRMHAKCSVPALDRFSAAMNLHVQPGKFLDEDHYYDFQARDMAGNQWEAERQAIKENSGLGDVVYSDLKLVHRKVDWAAPGWAKQWHVQVELDLPWNATTELPNGGWRFDRFVHEDDNYKWSVQKLSGRSKIELEVKSDPDPGRRALDFLWALSMLVGAPLYPIVSQTRDGAHSTTVLHRPVRASPNPLLKPLPPPQLDRSGDFLRFISCCLDAGTSGDPSPLRTIYQFWHRIQAAHEKDIENSALVLSVAIEGLIKGLCVNEHDVDLGLLPQLQAAAEFIKPLALSQRAREILTAALGNAKKPTARGVLFRLRDQGVIGGEHIEAWKRLRNTGAHGELLEDNTAALQAHLDNYWICLDLFYRLTLVAISYRGTYTNYSADGWPIQIFLAPAMALEEPDTTSENAESDDDS